MNQTLPKLEEMTDILDVKEMVIWDLRWVLVLLGIILVLVLAAVLFNFYQKRRQQRVQQEIPKTPKEKALHRLNQLKEWDFSTSNGYRQFYFELSDLFRDFLEEELSISAGEATQEELKPLLNGHESFTNEIRTKTFWLLELSDMAKFAKLKPASEEVKKSLQVCGALVDKLEIKEVQNQTVS